MTPILYQMEEPKNHIYIDTTWNKTSGIGAICHFLDFLIFSLYFESHL